MSAGEARPAISVQGLWKIYGVKEVVKDLSLEIRQGERLCVVGQNGSGKSTFLEILMGLRSVSRGDVLVFDLPARSTKLERRRAMLLDGATFPYYAKVREIVWMYCEFGSRYAGGLDLLRRFDLDPEAFLRHLSKGQKQRFGLVLTLLGNPDLILLDEPSSGLDPQARETLWEYLVSHLERRPATTLVFTSHELNEPERWSHRVAIMHRGSLVGLGPPKELVQRSIGATHRLSLAWDPTIASLRLGENRAVRSVRRYRDELAIFTDEPRQVLDQGDLATGDREIRLERVTFRDAFFHFTGEYGEEPLAPS